MTESETDKASEKKTDGVPIVKLRLWLYPLSHWRSLSQQGAFLGQFHRLGCVPLV